MLANKIAKYTNRLLTAAGIRAETLRQIHWFTLTWIQAKYGTLCLSLCLSLFSLCLSLSLSLSFCLYVSLGMHWRCFSVYVCLSISLSLSMYININIYHRHLKLWTEGSHACSVREVGSNQCFNVISANVVPFLPKCRHILISIWTTVANLVVIWLSINPLPLWTSTFRRYQINHQLLCIIRRQDDASGSNFLCGRPNGADACSHPFSSTWAWHPSSPCERCLRSRENLQ